MDYPNPTRRESLKAIIGALVFPLVSQSRNQDPISQIIADTYNGEISWKRNEEKGRVEYSSPEASFTFSEGSDRELGYRTGTLKAGGAEANTDSDKRVRKFAENYFKIKLDRWRTEELPAS